MISSSGLKTATLAIAAPALLVASLATNVYLNIHLHAESKAKDSTISLLEQQNVYLSRVTTERMGLTRPRPPVLIMPTLQTCYPYIRERERMGVTAQSPNLAPNLYPFPSPHQHLPN